MGTVTGYWGRDNYTLKLAGQASMNVTLPSNTYPSGTLELTSISSGSSPACWNRTGTSQTKHIDLYLCDSAGNNRVSLGGFNMSSATSKAYHTFTVGSGATALAGKALYIIATGDTDNIESYHKITFTLGTTTLNYAVSVNVSGGGGTLRSSHALAQPGTQITLTPTANTGYQFKSYSATGGVTISNNKFTMPSSNVTVTATFEKITYTITRKSNPTAAGAVTTSAATATMGTSITVGHTDYTGYEFWGYTTSPANLISSGSFTMPASNVTITGTWKRRSTCTVNKTTVKGGGTVKITINTEDSTYFHRFWLNFGTGMDSGWVDVDPGTTTYTYEIPTDWSNALPNTTSTTGWLRLRTYTDTTRQSMIASDYEITGLTYEVPTSIVPEIRTHTVVPVFTVGGVTYYNPDPNNSSIYTQNHVAARIRATAEGKGGASITSLAVKVGGYQGSDYQKTFSAASLDFTSGLLTTSGNLNVKVTATDSRGRTTTSTVTIVLTKYNKPSGTLAVKRVNSGGSDDPSGGYGKFKITKILTAVGANSWKTVKLTANNTSADISGQAVNSWINIFPSSRASLDGLREYKVELELEDQFEKTTITATLPSCRYTIFVNKYGDQMAFMQAVTKSIPANKGSTFEIPDNCQVYVGDSTLEDWTQAQAKTKADSIYGLQTSVNITATGTKTATVTGLTANHVVDNVDFFTNSGLTTPAAKPLADFKWTTSANTLTLAVDNVYASCYVRFHFTYKK